MNRAAVPERSTTATGLVSGLYAVTPEERDTDALAEKVRQALAGGARIVQYRNKSADRALRVKQAAALAVLCRSAAVPLVINDDLELALQIDADGLHVGRGDVDIARARKGLGEKKILGASCYDSVDRAVAASSLGADYVAFGSIFPSTTKPGASRAPLSLFDRARERVRVPIVAIGGITPENASSVIDAGADSIAVISALFDATDIAATARSFEHLFRRKSP
ncbi:MAG TPA: thiamine phosphate synthase [Burkholderiales bacterium]|jgi:thiamine-phosphate pyrophosphorylase